LQIAPRGSANKNNAKVKKLVSSSAARGEYLQKNSVSLLGSHDRFAATAFFTA
jgi:hypothetical protein